MSINLKYYRVFKTRLVFNKEKKQKNVKCKDKDRVQQKQRSAMKQLKANENVVRRKLRSRIKEDLPPFFYEY